MFGVLSMQVCECFVLHPTRRSILCPTTSPLKDIYYLAFPKDRVEYKALVYGLYLLETTQTMLFTSSAFRTFATGFREQASLDQVDTLWFSVPIMSGISKLIFFLKLSSVAIYKLSLVALIAQTSYAYRITVFTKSKYIAGVIILVRAFPSTET